MTTAGSMIPRVLASMTRRWRLSALALAAVALFGARPAEAALNVSSISVGAQTGTVCEGSTTTASYVVTVTAAGSGSAFDTTLSLSTAAPAGTSFSCVSSCTDHITSSGTSTVTINLTTASAVAQTATSFTVTESHNSKTSNGSYTANTKNASAGIDQSVCATTATLAGNAVVGGSGAWTVITGPATVTTPASPTSGVTGLGPGLNTFRWTISPLAACSGGTLTDDVNITNNLPTTATVGGPQTICALGTTAGLGGNTPTQGTGTWSVFSGGTGSFNPTASTPNATFTHATGAGPIVLHWTISHAPCSDSVASVTVTINTAPVISGVTANQTICAGGSASFTVSTSAGTNLSYQWYKGTGTGTPVANAAGHIAGATTATLSFTNAVTGDSAGYHVVVSNTGCTAVDSESSPGLRTLTVNAPPSSTITAVPSSVCASSTGNTASVPDAGGSATYSWSILSGGTITSATNTSSITYTAAASGPVDIHVTITVPGCTTANGSLSVTVNLLPATTAHLTGANPICLGKSFKLDHNGTPTNISCSWTASPEAGSGITNPLADASCSGPTITPTVAGTYVYTLTATDTVTGCVRVSTDSKTLEVAVTGTGIIAGSNAVCSGATGVPYSVSGYTNATTYTWTVPTGATVATGQGTASITVNFGSTSGNVGVTPSDSCGNGTPASLAVTVSGALGTTGTITGPASVCVPVSGVGYSTTTVTNADTYTWNYTGTGATINNQGTNSITIDFTGGATGGNLTVTPSSAGCGNGTASDPLAISIASAPTAVASGSATICLGGSGALLNGSGGSSCSWLPATGLSDANSCTPTATPTVTTTYSLTVSNGSCSSTNTAQVTVTVVETIAVTGNTEFCFDDLGGIATATAPTTGVTHFQWGYRTVSTTGTITDLAGHTNSSYTLQGADFPAPGTYYLVCTFYITGTECNTGSGTETIVSNEIAITIDSPCLLNAVPPPVQFFTLTTRNGGVSPTGTNILQWFTSGTAADNTELRARTDGTYPLNESDGTLVSSTQPGTANTKVTYSDSPLANGTTYLYSVFEYKGITGPVLYSGDKNVPGRPFTSPAGVKWSFSTGGIVLTTPGVRPTQSPTAGAIYSVSNNRNLDSMNLGSTGGDWPTSPSIWTPFAMNAPSQGRSIPVHLKVTSIGGSFNPVFVGATDGRVYAVDGLTGSLLWASPQLGDFITASPAAMFNEIHGGAPNVIMVGANSSTGNRFYGLNIADGSILWTFDDSGANDIGLISGTAAVDYTNNRTYFTSREGGANKTVWALNMSANPPTLVWAADFSDIDSSPNMANSTIYVGNNNGDVNALDPSTGASKWTGAWSTGDGLVKNLVWSVGLKLFFSTTSQVNAINDNGTGTAPTAFWTSPVVLPTPTDPIVNGGRAYVGGGDGRVYSIDANSTTPAAPTFTQLGDPLTPFQVGSPTLDNANHLLHLGSEPGQVYAVLVPF